MKSASLARPLPYAPAYRDAICVVVAIAALIIMIGWHTGHQELVMLWFTTVETTKCNTAASFILCSLAFILRYRSPLASMVASAFVAFLAGLTFMEYAGGIDLGIDTIFCPAAIEGSQRMAPQTAVAILSLGLALITTAQKNDRVRICVLPLTAIAQMMAVLGAIGYLMGVGGIYKIGSLAGMAPLTLIGLTLLSWCIQDEIGTEFEEEAQIAHSMILGALFGGILIAWLIAIQKVA